MQILEVGKVYKVNNTSFWKIMSVGKHSVLACPWPPRPRDAGRSEELTCGEESGNVFEEIVDRIIPPEYEGLSDTEAMVQIKTILDRHMMWPSETATDIAKVMDAAGYDIDWFYPTSEPRDS